MKNSTFTTFVTGAIVAPSKDVVTFVFDDYSCKIAELQGDEVATVLSHVVPPRFRGSDYLFAKILTSKGIVGYAMIDFMRVV